MLTMCGKLYIMTGVLPEVIQKKRNARKAPSSSFLGCELSL